MIGKIANKEKTAYTVLKAKLGNKLKGIGNKLDESKNKIIYISGK